MPFAINESRTRKGEEVSPDQTGHLTNKSNRKIRNNSYLKLNYILFVYSFNKYSVPGKNQLRKSSEPNGWKSLPSVNLNFSGNTEKINKASQYNI